MLTFSKIGRKGNLGNQLFQIASTIGIASEHKVSYGFSAWKYQEYFENELPAVDLENVTFEHRTEKLYEYHDWELDGTINYDLEGWLQTEKYFDVAKTKHYFTFKKELITKIQSLYAQAFEKETILISIRRGDFVNHADYYQTPIQYFISSLHTYFPDWLHTKNLIVLSDDLDYCKYHFSFLENAFFAENLNAVEQLCLGSLCDDFIISNSTFSWWSAWLGEKETSKVITPIKNFRGEKAKELNDKDYFPERWIKHDFLSAKVVLNSIKIGAERNSVELSEYINAFYDLSNAKSEITVQLLKSYVLPPLVYYLINFNNLSSGNIYSDNAVVKISKPYNYEEFIYNSYDFGFFSSVFNFESNKEVLIGTIKNKEHSNNTVLALKSMVGLFVNVGGYTFSYKRYLKKKEIQLKKTVKKIIYR